MSFSEYWQRWRSRNAQYQALPRSVSPGRSHSSKANTLMSMVYVVCRKRSFQFIAATAFVALLLLGIANQDKVTLDNIVLLASSIQEPEPRYLHLLIPSNNKHIDLSKNMLSAAINGMPVPTIINWQVEFTNTGLIDGGSHLGKITGPLDWMNKQGRDRDNDLVLVVDGYDVWFQLPARILINRYLEINKRARKRIQKDIGSKAMRAEGIDQHVIISAQKSCWPHTADKPACFAVPDSPLPEDVYGPNTDHKVKRPPSIQKFRSRYLNSGVMMGDLKHMRQLFERVKEKMAEEPTLGSDQRQFATVFGEQEYQRAVAGERYFTYRERIERLFGWRRPSILDPHPKHRKVVPVEGVNYEYGIGLDYEGLLGHAFHNAKEDGAWISFNDTDGINKAKKSLHNTAFKEISLPSDLEDLDITPFPDDDSKNVYPKDASWETVSLYTDLYTSVVPVLTHMNGIYAKYLTKEAWHKNWFQPYARQLLDAYVKSDDESIALSVEGGRTVEWWGVEKDRSVVRTFGRDGEGTVSWEELLDGYEEEIFRDGQGKWIVPK